MLEPPAWPPPPWYSRIDWRLVAVAVAVLFAISVNGEWVLSAK